jgi:nucleotide-binding universal stress UspA family protein
LNILVPVDGSENAFRAIDIACRLASAADAIMLLNVVGRGELPDELKRYAQLEHIEGPPEWRYEHEVALEMINAALERVRARGIENYDTFVRRGDPAKSINDVAEETGAELIVMGCRGLGALKGLAFGSVSQKVSHSAPCQVVTVS